MKCFGRLWGALLGVAILMNSAGARERTSFFSYGLTKGQVWKAQALGDDAEELSVSVGGREVFAIRAFSRPIARKDQAEFLDQKAEVIGGAGAKLVLAPSTRPMGTWKMGIAERPVEYVRLNLQEAGVPTTLTRFAISNEDADKTKFMIIAFIHDVRVKKPDINSLPQGILPFLDLRVRGGEDRDLVDLAAVAAAATAFLSATSVDALKSHVRDLERVSPLIDDYYAELAGGYQPFPLRRPVDTKSVTAARGFYVLTITDTSFREHSLWLRRMGMASPSIGKVSSDTARCRGRTLLSLHLWNPNCSA